MALASVLILVAPSALSASVAAAASTMFLLRYIWRRLRPRPRETREFVVRQLTERRDLGIYDNDTGLLAPWYFGLRAEEEWQRATRYQRHLSLVLVDVAEGEETADDWPPAERLSAWLGRYIRLSDLACHLGKGRFAILMPETGAKAAAAAAGRICSQPMPTHAAHASFPEEARTYDDLIALASRRLERLLGGNSRPAGPAP